MSHLLNQRKNRLFDLLDRAFIYVGNNSEGKVGRATIHVGKLSLTYIEENDFENIDWDRKAVKFSDFIVSQ